MSQPSASAAASEYVAVCTFKADTVMSEVFAVVAEEQVAVADLQASDRLGTVKISLPRNTVFLQIFADTPDGATATVEELPMAKWWDIDVFPIGQPAAPSTEVAAS